MEVLGGAEHLFGPFAVFVLCLVHFGTKGTLKRAKLFCVTSIPKYRFTPVFRASHHHYQLKHTDH